MNRQETIATLESLVTILRRLPDSVEVISAEITTVGTVPTRMHLSKGIRTAAKALGLKVQTMDAGDYTKLYITDKHGLFQVQQLMEKGRKKAAPSDATTGDGKA